MNLLSKITKFLASPFLALVLLIVFVIYIALGTKTSLSLSLYNSILFFVIIILFLINITVCTSKQIKRKRKNWGSVIFHAGLILIIIGGFVTYAFGFLGKFGLTEGQAFFGQFNGYTVKGPLASDYNYDLKVFLNKIEPKYLQNQTFSRSSILVLKNDSEQNEYLVSLGNPVNLGFYSITNDTLGYYISLKTLIEGKEGDINVGFDTLKHTNSETYKASMPVKDGAYIMQMEFYPDYKKYLKEHIKSGVEPKDPVISIKLLDQKRKFIAEKTIKMGEDSSLIKGINVKFSNFYYWASFVLKRDYGYPLINIGFLISIIGLSIIYIKFPLHNFVGKRRDSDD